MRAIDILGPIRKDVAEDLGLNRDTMVVVGTPDVQSAAIGSGCGERFLRDTFYIGDIFLVDMPCTL